MLECFLERNLCPKLEAVFIDEAQDLSPIQWEMVKVLEKNSRVCYVAGDDDQAIFRYAGADVDHFVNLKGKVTLLDQSYRIPCSHHEISSKVIQRIVGRRQKNFKPKEEQGSIHWHRHSEQVDLGEGDWLLLSRTTRGAQQIEEEVRRRGHLYIYNGSKSIDSKVLEAVRLWEFLREGNRLDADQVKLVYSQMLINSQVSYGCKTMPDGQEGTFYSLQDLQNNHGLMHNLPWDRGLGKISERDKTYIKACLRKGESLTKTPRIRISTIHSAKGGEEENVLIILDNTKTIRESVEKSQDKADEENRVWYVGVTRTRQNLYLLTAKKEEHGYDIESLGQAARREPLPEVQNTTK